MREEFQRRRGYDLTPYLPTYTGRVVTSQEVSERFLWPICGSRSRNWLRTTTPDACATWPTRAACGFPSRDTAVRRTTSPYAGRADEPMCEFWIGGNGFPTPKEMASAAHVYGHPVLGAEAFTADNHERWLQSPASIKALGDRAFCDGVNRFVFHRYALQPWTNRQPGMTMGPWGLHYERTNTWWEMSTAWHQYLARCQYLLRQGHFVADVWLPAGGVRAAGVQGRARSPDTITTAAAPTR